MDSRTTASIEQFVSLLLKCRKLKNAALSNQVHTHITYNGLEAHTVLGNYLVPIYVECGCILEAHYVFDTLVQPNEFSWTSFIQGHVEHGEFENALALFQSMQKSMVLPSNFTFVAVVKACAQLKVMDMGSHIHLGIVKGGLDGDLYVSNSLVDMYARCGCLSEAHKVFDLLPLRVVVSWNILLTAYLDYGYNEKVLECLDQMQSKDVLPNVITFICSLKACSSLRSVAKGEEIHCEVVRGGLERDLSVGTTLVNMYAKCGLLVEAQSVIDQLQTSNNVPWNALITGHVENNSGEEALKCMDQMQRHGISSNAVSFVCGLKACIITQDLGRGQELHAEIINAGLDRVPSVGNSLIDMYAKCGAILETLDVFDKLPDRCVVSWTALIACYIEYGFNEEAATCLKKMCSEGLSPDAATYVCSLRACGSLETTSMGQELHAMILKKGLERNLYVGNMLVDMYIKGGYVAEGQVVFDCLPSQSLVSWNTLISGYAEHGLGRQSLNCYNLMQVEGTLPDVATFICTLKACGNVKEINMGRQLHANIIKMGLEFASFVGNSIVDMYAKCGSLVEAQHVFDLLPERSIVSWNSIITGFSEHGLGEDVLKLVEQMGTECFSLDATTHVCSLKASSSAKLSSWGQKQHVQIIMKGLEEHPFVGSALVDMYANCGLLVEAQQVLDELPVRNVVVWTALITGYAEHGLGVEALECLEKMLLDGILPNIITYACVLKVCGNLSSIIKGEEVHIRIAKEGFYGEAYDKGERDMLPPTHEVVRPKGTEVLLFNALIDMYCKCGSMVDAQSVCDKLLAIDLTTWNVLLTGYARQGDCELVFHVFERLRTQGVEPNEVMFLSVFSVCSHEGLVRIGLKCFKAMNKEYNACPTLEHYNCLIDIFSRAGQLQEAITVLDKMPFEPDLVTWSTLLGACRNWGDVDLGRQSFEWVTRLDKGNAAAFIVMSNIYAEADMWEDAQNMEALF